MFVPAYGHILLSSVVYKPGDVPPTRDAVDLRAFAGDPIHEARPDSCANEWINEHADDRGTQHDHRLRQLFEFEQQAD